MNSLSACNQTIRRFQIGESMKLIDVYVYGMTVLSTIHRLAGAYPQPDGYQEIRETHVMPGGEAANCAIVLSNLGKSVSLDGCYLGEETGELLLRYLGERRIDCSLLRYEEGFAGWRDIVVCDGESRTVFGWYISGLFGGRKLWNPPSEEAIMDARCAALDPFFGEESALASSLCVKHGKAYVTIDCKPDSPVARNARAIVCSREFLDREYPGCEYGSLLSAYGESCKGLVIFTFGGGEDILYVSNGEDKIARCTPYRVRSVDTLAAGDTFRAGVLYGVLSSMPEPEIVRFAAASAAVACTRFPSVSDPPSLEEIRTLIGS
jgi:hypothetical protein